MDPQPATAVPRREAASRPRRWAAARRLALRAGLPALAGVALLWLATPRILGAPWVDVAGNVAGLSAAELAGLTALWFVGLWAHSFVLTGALPGLTRRRALTLNLTGSAIANVLPLGGAAGISLNRAMTRSWRLRDSSFASFTLVTNVWNVLAKLALPVVAGAALVGYDGTLRRGPLVTAGVGAVGGGVVVAVAVAALASERATTVVARLAERCVEPVRRRTGRTGHLDLVGPATRVRQESASVVAHRWPQLTTGMAAYVILQAGLLWACLRVTGSTLPPSLVLAGFAVERLLTLAVVTPGGVGIADTGAAATIIALGGDPLTSVAGVLLYRGFTFLLEIPVGGAWLAVWLALTRRSRGALT